MCFEVPPFHWIDDYRKKIERIHSFNKKPIKIFFNFSKTFWGCLYLLLLLFLQYVSALLFTTLNNFLFCTKWAFRWKSSKLNNAFQPILLFFIYTNMNNWIYMIFLYSGLYNVPNISEVLRNEYGLYSSFHSLLNSLQILSQRKIVENDTCIKMLL